MADWAAVVMGASALVTAVSALFIAWQAYETRRTSGATQRLVSESVKARLDARAPRLLVAAACTRDEVPRHWSGITGQLGQEWPAGGEFRRTKDDSEVLVLGAQFEVTNEGDRSVDVRVDGDFTLLSSSRLLAREEDSRVVVSLARAAKYEFRVESCRSLREWAEEWNGRESGSSGAAMARASVTCSDPYDDGTIDRWDLTVVCYPVRPKQGDNAAWVIRRREEDPAVVSARVDPPVRRYFLSKASDRLLGP